jgi:putative cofactor-binding repeat protein
MKRTRSSLLAASLLAAALPQEAQAASITVDAGGTCTLAEAITSANNDTASGNGCVDGSGADTITLQADVTLAADLPQITTAITIEGGGHFISGNNARRVLYVASSGSLTLNATTVKDGKVTISPFHGGGIYNFGTVTLNSSAVSGNTASGSSGQNWGEGFGTPAPSR